MGARLAELPGTYLAHNALEEPTNCAAIADQR
jgi:hypothetical protein